MNKTIDLDQKYLFLLTLLFFVLFLSPLKTFAAERRLVCKHVPEDVFNLAIANAREYNPEDFSGISAGVVPHHLTAAPMIGGFFRAAAESAEFDSVIIIGPNHEPSAGEEVVVSSKGWGKPGSAEADAEIVEKIKSIKLTNGTIAENNKRMEDDHAVSSLIPFINYYWREAKAAPVLISGNMTYADAQIFADGITEIVKNVDESVLVLFSVDFSHYLTPEESRTRDRVTRSAIENFDYGTIRKFTDANADSPASLIIFLRLMENLNGTVKIIDNADASAFTKVGSDGTTSYFIISGAI